MTLMEQGNVAEARNVFRTAFGLDRGLSTEIRENLRLAIAKTENTAYDTSQNDNFELVRRGSGSYLLLSTP